MKENCDVISDDWKISRVLSEYPALLDTLVDLTPAFAKLNNPVLRKVQSRLVTVRQAAGIAGIPTDDLVRTLNSAVGNDTPASFDSRPTVSDLDERPAWVGSAPLTHELDTRSLLEQGLEPFGVISEAAAEVPVGSVLRLLAGFEPVPLYDALGKQGFDHWTREVSPSVWQVDFHRARPAGKSVKTANIPNAADWAESVTAEVTIDDSELVPPEPMVKILQALENLPAGNTLLVHHVRRPIHLYPQLEDLGYQHVTRDIEAGKVELRIHKPVTTGAPS